MDSEQIERVLREMAAVFARAAHDHLTYTRPVDIEEFENGLYAVAYAAPSKRFKRTLLAEREVAVILSNFDEQQQRIVKFAKSIIDRSDGRLESRVAVIVHRDARGNEKISYWGRDMRLSLLPIVWHPGMASGAEFERSLFREVYSQDPFDVTGPVSDDANFFGRREEALDLARKLQQGQIRSLLGLRKVGKTSVINRVVQCMRVEYDCTTVMIDCSQDTVCSMGALELLSTVAHTAKLAVERGFDYVAVHERAAHSKYVDMASCVRLLGSLSADCGRPLVLIFDEVDYITPNSPTAAATWIREFNPFWRNLRVSYQEASRLGGAFSLLISGVSSRSFCIESVGGVENAALAFVPEEYLSPLSRTASVEMIRRLGRRAGLVIGQNSADRIASSAGDMPYWIRKVCSYIHRQVDVERRPYETSAQEVDRWISQFLSQEGAAISQVVLQHLFRVYPELESACRACADGRAAESSLYLRSVLAKYGVISARGDVVCGDMLLAGLELHSARSGVFSSQAIVAEPDEVDGSAGPALAEWAEELAVVGKRRNMLEKRLRQMVLNFILMDSLQKKDKPRPKERILKVKPERDRQRAAAHTAEDVMESMLWTELVALIGREWALFAGVFGDKNKFAMSCEIVNDRFDAHAKDADAADLALYRRALDWLEDRIKLVQ